MLEFQSQKYKNGLFIFRRDLRIIDNTALIHLSNHCENIYTIFIFTPEQVGKENKYKSDNAVLFMIESLMDLHTEIKKKGGELYTFYGTNKNIVQYLIPVLDIQVCSFNIDYTPYAVHRDREIIEICDTFNVQILNFISHDYYLHIPGTILNNNKQIYMKFTPFYNIALKLQKKIKKPNMQSSFPFRQTNKNMKYMIDLYTSINKFTHINPNILLRGGRTNAFKYLPIAKENIYDYDNTRDYLIYPTSQLSSYIKFGCLSIREIFYLFKNQKNFIRQLYWREFYIDILYYYPHVLYQPFKINYKDIQWSKNETNFNHWMNATTGFPIVDACMRQLNTTGYMHNRGRLIVSSFLIKTLLIDWRKGEKYFANKLIDYDVSNNNGNWQWISGTGADSQPYFRIFNPYIQSEKFDKNCEFIKYWIPELRDVPFKIIHNWNKHFYEYKHIHYPPPIVDYYEQKIKALQLYKKIM